MAAACASPLESLPHTVFPNDPHNYHHQQSYQNQQQQQQQQQTQHVNFPPPRTCFSPQLTRDYYQTSEEENSSLQYQVSNFVYVKFNFKTAFFSACQSLSLTKS